MKTKIFIVEHCYSKPGPIHKSLILIQDDTPVDQVIKANVESFGYIESIREITPKSSTCIINYI